MNGGNLNSSWQSYYDKSRMNFFSMDEESIPFYISETCKIVPTKVYFTLLWTLAIDSYNNDW